MVSAQLSKAEEERAVAQARCEAEEERAVVSARCEAEEEKAIALQSG